MIKAIINTSLTDRLLVLIATFFEPRRQCAVPGIWYVAVTDDHSGTQ